MNKTLIMNVILNQGCTEREKEWTVSEWKQLIEGLQSDKIYPGNPSSITFLLNGVTDKNEAFAKEYLANTPFQVIFSIELAKIGATDYLTWDKISALSKEGFEFAAKGILRNRFLPKERTQLQMELEVPKRLLTKKTQKEVEFFQLDAKYVSRQLIGLAYNAGYKGVISLKNGVNAPESNCFVKRSFSPTEYASADECLASVCKAVELSSSSNVKNWIEGKVRNQFDIGLMNRASALLMKMSETNY